MLELRIETTGDAFKPLPHAELSSILRNIASRLDRGEGTRFASVIFDTNGNACGSFRLVLDKGA